MAQRITEQHPPALVDLARLLARQLQAERIAQLVLDAREHPSLPRLDADSLWFDTTIPLTPEGAPFFSVCPLLPEETRMLDLARDVVLPWPWNRERLAATLASIGPGRQAGPWKQDRLNHRVEWWIPLGLGLVEGGTHSLSVGIVQAQGRVTASVRSLAPLYDHVHCDGASYRRTCDQHLIGCVKSPLVAGLFEIGRLLLQQGISA